MMTVRPMLNLTKPKGQKLTYDQFVNGVKFLADNAGIQCIILTPAKHDETESTDNKFEEWMDQMYYTRFEKDVIIANITKDDINLNFEDLILGLEQEDDWIGVSGWNVTHHSFGETTALYSVRCTDENEIYIRINHPTPRAIAAIYMRGSHVYMIPYDDNEMDLSASVKLFCGASIFEYGWIKHLNSSNEYNGIPLVIPLLLAEAYNKVTKK